MFPAGAAGIALLTLRLGLVGIILTWTPCESHLIASPWIWLFVGFVSLCLSIGLYTPVICAVCFLAEGLNIPRFHGLQIYQAALLLPVTVSLAILGPGAYSVDARLFGRRVIVSVTLPGLDG